MSDHCGIWIDHRRAIIVMLENGNVTVQTLPSDVDLRPRRKGGSTGTTASGRRRMPGGGRAAGPQDAMPEDRIDRKHKAALEHFYRRVVSAAGGVGSVLLFGPGEAKTEMSRVLDDSPGAADRSVWVEPADKLTDRQIVARVRAFFGEGAPGPS